MAPRGSGKKRARSEASSAALPTESSDLNAALMDPACEQLVTPFNSIGVHDMMVKGQRAALAEALWRGNFEESMAVLRAANADLLFVLRAQIQNTGQLGERGLARKERLLDGLLLNLWRAALDAPAGAWLRIPSL